MPTENHSLKTPGRGEPDWDVPLNSNTTDLDTKVEIRDSDANRDSYAPKAGAKFVATDTGAVYFGDGETWTKQGEIATHPTVTTASASGDGTATTFTITHGLGAVPSGVQLTPTSAAANGPHHVENVTADSFDVVFETAPASGTDNLTFAVTLYP